MKKQIFNQGNEFFKSQELDVNNGLMKAIPTMIKENKQEVPKKNVSDDVRNFIKEVESNIKKLDEIVKELMQKKEGIRIGEMYDHYNKFKDSFEMILNDFINYPIEDIKPMIGNDRSVIKISKY